MEPFLNPGEALVAITQFLVDHLNEQPEELRPRLMELGSGADAQMRIINMGEYVYAHRDAVTDDAKILAARIAHFGDSYGLHWYRDGRGFAMMKGLLRDVGETAPAGTEWPAAEDDPAPRPEWAETPDPSPAPAPFPE